MTTITTKTRRHQAILSAILCALAAAAALFGQNPSPAPSPEAAQAMVNRYCTNCHNEDLKAGGVSLVGVRASAVGAAANTWEKVLRKVRTGEMPPLAMPRPDSPALASFTTWLETELDRAAVARPNPGTPSIHRLNRAEYGNAIRDLLALDLDHSASLPADDSGYGFDNIGDVLTVSPLHLEKYMTTARRVSRLAVGTVKLSPAIEKFPRRARPAKSATKCRSASAAASCCAIISRSTRSTRSWCACAATRTPICRRPSSTCGWTASASSCSTSNIDRRGSAVHAELRVPSADEGGHARHWAPDC